MEDGVGPEQATEIVSSTVLQLSRVSKSFGSARAVDSLSIDVHDGEILTLLGPSGCGKSTTMRLIMGLERCDEGEITYQGQVVDSAERGVHLAVHKRQMGMVFQSYAIWPHMTVFENVAYPLRLRRFNGSKITEAVDRVLDLVGLTGFEDRPSPNLSGGQQQRVALARSLVFEPKILLLDEPFSNLDARLREQMRAELRLLQRRLGITVVFVTHDQVEALSLSDRIAVMNAGRIEQVGEPLSLYDRPGTPSVRDFLGRTAMLQGRVQEITDDGLVKIELDAGGVVTASVSQHAAVLTENERCNIAIRPEKIAIGRKGSSDPHASNNTLHGIIEVLLFVGDRYEARISLSRTEAIPAYLPVPTEWNEGQDVDVYLPPAEVQIWPI